MVESGDYLRDHEFGSGKEVEVRKPQHSMAFQDELILLSAIPSKRLAIGVKSLAIESDDQLDASIDEVDSGDEATTNPVNGHLTFGKVDACRFHDSKEFILHDTFGDHSYPLHEHLTHGTYSVPALAGDTVQYRGNCLDGCQLPADRFVQATRRESFTPRDPHVDERPRRSRTSNPGDHKSIGFDQIGAPVNGVVARWAGVPRDRDLDCPRPLGQVEEVAGSRVGGNSSGPRSQDRGRNSP